MHPWHLAYVSVPLLVTATGYKTATILFKNMLESIFCAPMSFFNATPAGRIRKCRMLFMHSSTFFTLHKLHVINNNICNKTRVLVFDVGMCRLSDLNIYDNSNVRSK